MKVRALNHAGAARFEAWLGDLRRGHGTAVPRDILIDESSSYGLAGDASVEERRFRSRLEAAQYFEEQLRGLEPGIRENDRGLWSWLALFYFDQTCPVDAKGHRRPGEDYRHVPSSDYRYYYRHLLLGPYRIWTTCRPHGRAMLSGPFGSHGDFAEQVASRQELLVNRGLVELIDRFYYDSALDQVRRGATNRKREGTLRRLISVVDQLDLTYDLYSLSADEIEALLPSEFDRWREP